MLSRASPLRRPGALLGTTIFGTFLAIRYILIFPCGSVRRFDTFTCLSVALSRALLGTTIFLIFLAARYDFSLMHGKCHNKRCTDFEVRIDFNTTSVFGENFLADVKS